MMILTDKEIEDIAQKFIMSIGDHWCTQKGIEDRDVEDFARAIEKAIIEKNT